MATLPKSTVNVSLADEEDEDSLAKAASLPGNPGGDSSARDKKDETTVTTDGITVSTDTKDEGPVLAARDSVKVVGTGGNGFSIVNEDGTPATGYVFIGGNLMTHAEFTASKSAQTIASAPDPFAGGTPTSGGPSAGGSAANGGGFTPPKFEFTSGDGSTPTFADIFAGHATQEQFDFNQFNTIGTAFEDSLKAILDAKDITSLQKFLNDPNNAPLLDRPSFEITEGFLNSIDLAQAQALRESGQTHVFIGKAEVYDFMAQQMVPGFVYLDADGFPIRGVASVNKDGIPIEGKPILAPDGQRQFDMLDASRSALMELNRAETAQLSQAQLDERMVRIRALLDEQSNLKVAAYQQYGSQQQTKLAALLEFQSASALSSQQFGQAAALQSNDQAFDAAKTQFGADVQFSLADQTFQNQSALNEDDQRFRAGLAQYEANNQFQIQALGFAHQSALKSMELAWLHGSPEDARSARLMAQDLDRRRVQLQERELLVSTLAILGQHPHLRGLIQGLGIFKGGAGGGAIDLDAFFTGNLPLDAIPSAQEFNLMTPAAQEGVINNLAGKYGISPEVIMATIRQQQPVGTRTLR